MDKEAPHPPLTNQGRHARPEVNALDHRAVTTMWLSNFTLSNWKGYDFFEIFFFNFCNSPILSPLMHIRCVEVQIASHLTDQSLKHQESYLDRMKRARSPRDAGWGAVSRSWVWRDTRYVWGCFWNYACNTSVDVAAKEAGLWWTLALPSRVHDKSSQFPCRISVGLRKLISISSSRVEPVCDTRQLSDGSWPKSQRPVLKELAIQFSPLEVPLGDKAPRKR